jgi:superfamily II DNA or RNA helicase
MKLREYQAQAIEQTFEAWQGHPSVLGVMPTGAGKTIVASEIIKRTPGRTIVLCHTTELVSQFARALWRFGIDSEIEKADLWAETQNLNGVPVVIATPQTLFARGGARLRRWAPDDFSLLIVDEGHHYSGAPAFEGVVQHFKQNPELRCLVLTATPDRHDGIALARICEEVAFRLEITGLINEGYLVGVDQYLVKIESLDLSTCRVRAGDFHGGELAAILEREKLLLGMADATLKTIGEKKTLVFAHSVKQAERLAEIFNRHRPGIAGCVFGHTLATERAQIFQSFAGDDLQILVNVGVAGEGYDNPRIEAIVCARPTKSRARYAQQLGRGLRPLSGLIDGLETAAARREAIANSPKAQCLVLDFAGNSGRHALVNAGDILGQQVSEQARELAHRRILKQGRGAVLAELERAEKELREEQERQLRRGLVVHAQHRLTYVDPFDVFNKRASKWRGFKQFRALSRRQRKLLMSHGYNPDEYTPAEAQSIIGALFAMSEKQRVVLLRAGYSEAELKGIRKWEATEMIKFVAANGWQRPEAPAAS